MQSNRRPSVVSRYRVSRRNSAAYGNAAQEPDDVDDKTTLGKARQIRAKVQAIVDATGLTPETVIACRRAMTKMGKAAHLPAGTARCRDIARHRLAEAILAAPQDAPVRQYRRRCMEASASILDDQASPAEILTAAADISRGRPPSGPNLTPMAVEQCRQLANERSQYPSGLWSDLERCGHRDLPSDAMLGHITRALRDQATQTLTMSEIENLYLMISRTL